MAKKKAKRKATKRAAPRKTKRVFWGDGALAFFYFLKIFLILGGIGILASIGLGLEFAEPLKTSLLKQTADPEILSFIHGLDQTKGIGIAVAIVGLIPLSFLFIRALARANKFALAFVILENGVNVALLLMSTKNESRIGAILPILFLIFALLRIFGAVGPKIR